MGKPRASNAPLFFFGAKRPITNSGASDLDIMRAKGKPVIKDRFGSKRFLRSDIVTLC